MSAAPEPTVDLGKEPPAGHRPATPPQPRLIPPPPHGRRAKRLSRMAATGGAKVDRVNRAVFVILGLVLVAVGVGGLLLYNGTIHTTQPNQFYADRVGDARGSQDLSAAIAAAVCLVVFLLAVRWALAQLRPVNDGERVGTVRLFNGPKGRTTVAATTMARAASADLADRRGVASGRVRIRAVRPTPRVQMTIEMDLTADPDQVLAEADNVLHNLLGVLGASAEDSDTEIRLRFAKAGRSRAPQTSRVS